MKNSPLQNSEICCLAISLTSFRIFTSLPVVFSRTSGTGAPLSTLLSGILVIAAVFFLSARLKGNSIISFTKTAFAKYTISVLALIYLCISALFTLTEFSQFAKATSFPATPVWFISLFFIIASGIAALKGISPLLRICRYFIPIFVAVVSFLILSVLWKCNPTNLFPLLGNGLNDTLGKGLGGILLYSDISLIFLIDQSQGIRNKSHLPTLCGCVIGVLLCFCVVFAFTAKIPYPLSKDEQLPLYLLMKEVYYGRFFQRIDAVVLLVSALWGMLSLCLNLCLITKILEDTFAVTSKPAAIFPLGAALFFLSIKGMDNIFSILLYSAAALVIVLIFPALLKTTKEAVKYEK